MISTIVKFIASGAINRIIVFFPPFLLLLQNNFNFIALDSISFFFSFSLFYSFLQDKSLTRSTLGKTNIWKIMISYYMQLKIKLKNTLSKKSIF